VKFRFSLVRFLVALPFLRVNTETLNDSVMLGVGLWDWMGRPEDGMEEFKVESAWVKLS
jgi:hypothetical protein